ncbi:MAG: TatD family hydrolase [Candidatus Omnitrophica bacterium]|nr:TatD family hydrolase [Candidatus Omnitrophota bacterium]
MNIYDTHAHLDHIEDLSPALERAVQTGVKGVVAVSISLKSCTRTLEIAKEYSNPIIYPALGMHPSDADRNDVAACIDLIKENVSRIIAVGEIGLDFWYKWVRKDKEKKDEQREVFQAFLNVARETNLPAIIHTRGTWREAFDRTKATGLTKALFHWYSGPVDVLKDILDAGYYVSTSPSVAYSPQSREAMSYAPIEQTLIETDSPVFYKNRDTDDEGFKAEPKDVLKTLSAYSKLKNVSEDKTLSILNNNAETFFNFQKFQS